MAIVRFNMDLIENGETLFRLDRSTTTIMNNTVKTISVTALLIALARRAVESAKLHLFEHIHLKRSE